MARFTNQAQLAYNNSITNSNIAVGEIQEVLTATKTAVRDEYGQNDRITYIISLVNSGTTPLTGLTVIDNLGEYEFGCSTLVPLTYEPHTIRYYINGAIQHDPVISDTTPLTITGISIPAGGNVIIVYEVAVNMFAPLGRRSSITNRVTVFGGITPVTACETVTAESAPLLAITKSISPVPVTENGVLTYTFVIQNSGNRKAGESSEAVITDIFNPILCDLTVTFNGETWTEGTNYTYNEHTGTFTTIAGEVTVPAATYTQNPETGVWVTNPGVSTLVISGTV